MRNEQVSSRVSTIRRAGSAGAGLAVVAAVLLGPSRPLRAEGSCEVRITVKDEAGAGQGGVEITLQPCDKSENPITSTAPSRLKTNSKGVATFPFVQYNGQGEGRYAVIVEKEGYYIHEFRIESRQPRSQADKGAGTLIQDNEGKISQRQKMPPLQAKPGGHATVAIILAPLVATASPAEGGSGTPTPGAAGGASIPLGSAPPDPFLAAKALGAQGKYEEAEAALKALAASDPQAKYEFELSKVYHSQDRSSDERAALQRTLEKDPSYPGAHYMLGKLAYGDDRVPEAITHLEAEVAAHPEDSASQSTLGKVYDAAGRKGEAIHAYEAIVQRESDNADALVALGALYASHGDLKKSEDAYKRVLAIDPGKADQVYYKVGVAISEQNDLSEAERQRAADAFRKTIELNPKHAKAHLKLGYVLVGMAKNEEARAHFQSYLDLVPNAPDASAIREFLKGM